MNQSRLFTGFSYVDIQTSALVVGPEKTRAIFREEVDFAIDCIAKRTKGFDLHLNIEIPSIF